MLTSFQEGPQNCIALCSLLEPDAFEMVQENSFGLADVLPRDGRLIVDSFLQHVGAAQTLQMIMRAKGSNMILGEFGLRKSTPLCFCAPGYSPRSSYLFLPLPFHLRGFYLVFTPPPPPPGFF